MPNKTKLRRPNWRFRLPFLEQVQMTAASVGMKVDDFIEECVLYRIEELQGKTLGELRKRPEI